MVPHTRWGRVGQLVSFETRLLRPMPLPLGYFPVDVKVKMAEETGFEPAWLSPLAFQASPINQLGHSSSKNGKGRGTRTPDRQFFFFAQCPWEGSGMPLFRHLFPTVTLLTPMSLAIFHKGFCHTSCCRYSSEGHSIPCL